MDPGPILYTEIQSTAILILLFSANNHLPHNTVNPLLQQAGEIDNLTVSLGQSTLVVLCRFHVLSPDFGQIRRWAVREMGLEDYTWKISEAALNEEFGLDCPCICNIVDRILV